MTDPDPPTPEEQRWDEMYQEWQEEAAADQDRIAEIMEDA